MSVISFGLTFAFNAIMHFVIYLVFRYSSIRIFLEFVSCLKVCSMVLYECVWGDMWSYSVRPTHTHTQACIFISSHCPLSVGLSERSSLNCDIFPQQRPSEGTCWRVEHAVYNSAVSFCSLLTPRISAKSTGLWLKHSF